MMMRGVGDVYGRLQGDANPFINPPPGQIIPPPVGSDGIQVVVLPLTGGSTYTNPTGVSQPLPLPTGITYTNPNPPASNPFAGLSASTGLSATTLMLIAGGAILFFAMKK